MKKIYKRIIAVSMIAAMGVSIVGCGKNKDKDETTENNTSASVNSQGGEQGSEQGSAQDNSNSEAASGNGNSPLEIQTLAQDDTSSLKQNLTVTILDNDVAPGVDATEAPEGAGNENTQAAEETKIVEVTDNEGNPQTDDQGNKITEIVKEASYVPDIKTAETYWLDMTQQKDFIFNGQFLVANFKIKDTTPDGSYEIGISKTDVGNWDAQTLTPDQINGYVTVGNAETPAVSSPVEGNFTFSAESAKGNAGDEVQVIFDVTDNPGIVAFVFCFTFDANALEFQGLEIGTDAEGIIELDKA